MFKFVQKTGNLSLIWLTALGLLAGASQAMAAPQLISPVAALASQKSAPAVKSKAFPVRFNVRDMLDLPTSAEIELTLPNAKSYTIIFERSEQHGGGIASWVGYLKERGKDYRVIVTNGPGGSFGSIRTPEGEFRLIPGEGHDWLVDMALEQPLLPDINLENDMLVPPKTDGLKITSQPKFLPQNNRADFSTFGNTKAAPFPQVVIDLMVVYTTGLSTKLGANLVTRLNNLVVAANTAYIDSEVAITLRLVNAVMVNYADDAGATDTASLYAITPPRAEFNAAVFGNIESQRTASGADLVALLRDGPDFSGHGIAWRSGASPNPLYLYSVTTGCVLGCDVVFIHELGHNMGNAHDRATVAFQAGGVAVPPAGAYPYSFGYYYCATGLNCIPNLPPGNGCTTQPTCLSNHVDNFGDIMSYMNPRILKFSNPGVTCTPPGGAGRACGVTEADSNNSANLALSMNNMRTVISGIKATVVTSPPGAIQFSANAFSGTEVSGTINFAVSRIGGSSGAVSVSYATSNASALAGQDYTSVSGSLNWADGDSANKTISVPIINDGVTESSEVFTVTLSSPSGATGVYLGVPSVASGIILEAWPPGGAIPAGFTSSVGSSAPWAVATDSVYEGPNSLKSGAIASLATNSFSAIEFTGNFAAGLVAFAYRVDSYPGFGPFEFAVDGTAVFTDSGNIGWRFYTYQIAAGMHTLRWKQTKVLSFPCANASPAPPQGAACADRAWIDAVVLPLSTSPPPPPTCTLAASPTAITVGATSTLTASCSPAATSYAWSNAACSSSSAICTVAPTVTTTYSVIGNNAAGAGGSVGATVTVGASFTRLVNLSTRGQVQTGDNVMIGGFIISGASSKTVLIRAVGPNLANFGVPGVLADPMLQLFSGQTVIASNDDWSSAANAAAIQATGLAPANSLEAAILITLAPGAYTAIVSGFGGATGVGIVEVFELDRPEYPLINISTRGRVQTGDSVMIGGFIIGGTTPKTVLIRAVGPNLANFGVPGVLANPALQLFSGQTVIASNDDWGSAANAAAIQATGLAPVNSLESAILITLAPGAYTAIVSGVGGGTGVGIVEVFAQ